MNPRFNPRFNPRSFSEMQLAPLYVKEELNVLQARQLAPLYVKEELNVLQARRAAADEARLKKAHRIGSSHW